jgi:hypothetical protein
MHCSSAAPTGTRVPTRSDGPETAADRARRVRP